MIISRIAIERPVFTTMCVAALVVFGFTAYQGLGVDLFPRVEFPTVTVVTRVPGVDPSTIETSVTDLVEEAVNTVSGIKHLRSTSVDSVSQVVIEFELGKPVDVAFQEITAKVAAVRAELPADAEEPVIEKLDVDAAPVLTVVVAGDVPYRELARIADKDVKERLQRVRNVGSARLIGFRDRKIWLWLDPVRLDRHGLVVLDVLEALRRQHVEIPGGKLATDLRDTPVKLSAEFRSAEEFDELVVAERGGAVVRLRDVGRAEDGLEEETSRARLEGRPCIALAVRRQAGTNAVETADAIVREVEKLRVELKPRGVRLELAEEQAPYIRRSVDEVRHHLVVGGGLAVLVVLLFLLNLRSTLISSIVLPASVIGTFAIMAALGFTLNMMTLLGLTLAVGLLIDDAIVVQENIMRHVEEGSPARTAAYEATREIGLAVVATTLSVVAVFVPVAFMGGIVGRFFAPFALTVSAAVLLSMFVSFTVDPMLSSRILKKPGRKNVLFRGLERLFAALERAYAATLRGVLRFRLPVLLVALAAFGSIGYLGGKLGFEFVPVEDQSEFNVKVRAPLGSSVNATSAVLEAVAARIADLPEKEYGFYVVGADELRRANEGSLYVKLVPKARRTRSQSEIMQAVREKTAGVPGATISVQVVPRLAGGGRRWAELQFDLRGDRLDELDRVARELMARMRAAGGYVDVDSTFETGRPEIDVSMLRDRAADLGVSPADLGRTLRVAVGGADVATFKSDGDRFDVAVRLLETSRDRAASVDDLRIRTRSGGVTELRNIATAEAVGAPVEINRYNRRRQITVLANLNGKVLGPATQEIDRFVAEIGLPPGYASGWTGFAEEMRETAGHMLTTLILALLVIYMVLASQFESFLHPFTIMLTLPLAFVGAFAALVAFGMTVSIYVSMALIFLMGLVTKNAILLVDQANTVRAKEGLDAKAAMLRAGPVRLRPILMTTVAMIAGMLPVALSKGEGSESRGPMATAIVGGLVSSTVLTLLVVPVVYSYFDGLSRFGSRMAAKFARNRAEGD